MSLSQAKSASSHAKAFAGAKSLWLPSQRKRRCSTAATCEVPANSLKSDEQSKHLGAGMTPQHQEEPQALLMWGRASLLVPSGRAQGCSSAWSSLHHSFLWEEASRSSYPGRNYPLSNPHLCEHWEVHANCVHCSLDLLYLCNVLPTPPGRLGSTSSGSQVWAL